MRRDNFIAIVIVVLLLAVFPWGGGPGWTGFGYYPFGGLGSLLLLIILRLIGLI